MFLSRACVCVCLLVRVCVWLCLMWCGAPAPFVCSPGIRVIYGRSHIYLNLGICLGCKIQVSDLASFVDVIDVHVYFWCHSLVLIFYHIA